MKKRLLLGLLLLGAAPTIVSAACDTSCNTSCKTSCNDCACPSSSKTFFAARPMYQEWDGEFVTSFRTNKMVAAQDGMGGALDFVLFGGQSTKGDDLAQYFMPYCKNCLSVNELISAGSPADLLSTNFNIFTVNGTPCGSTPATTGFASEACFSAKQSVIGFGMHYLQGFAFNCDRNKWWYLDVSTSVQRVKNKMEICETVTDDGGGVNLDASPNAVANLTEAFKQSSWKYGRIDNCCSNSKTRLADIELKIGYQWMYSDHCRIASYGGILIPTGNKAKGELVFESIVGNGGHFGVMWGQQIGFRAWTNCDNTWNADFNINLHSLYLFSNKQVRSFDLKGKPWSRYQEVYASLEDAELGADQDTTCLATNYSTPGINVFTKCLKVTPGFQYNATGALTFMHNCGFEGELGYNFFSREAECVRLANKWIEGPALKAASGEGNTSPLRNISNNPLSNSSDIENSLANYSASIITASDLDLGTAANPGIQINMVYGSLGYNWETCSYPMHANIGGSYEFGKDITTMDRYTVWGKVGVAF